MEISPKIGCCVTSIEEGVYDWIGKVIKVSDFPLWNFNFFTKQISVACDKNDSIKCMFDDNCDYLFLWDDDCYPIKQGWADLFINAHKSTGIHSFVLCKPDHNQFIKQENGIDYYYTGTGCMIFLTRKVIETVGYMNTAYHKYGYEHAAYSNRIWRAGLTPAWYCSVPGWEEYVYSWDLDKQEGKQGAVWEGMEHKADYIALNEDEYNREITSPQLYYPYAVDGGVAERTIGDKVSGV